MASVTCESISIAQGNVEMLKTLLEKPQAAKAFVKSSRFLANATTGIDLQNKTYLGRLLSQSALFYQG